MQYHVGMDTRSEQLAGSLALLVFLLLLGYAGSIHTQAPSNQPSTLTEIVPKSTLRFDPSLIIATSTVEALIPHVASTPAKTASQGAAPTKPTVPASPKAPASTTAPQLPNAPSAAVPVPVEKPTPLVAPSYKTALVNILCTSHTQNLRGLSGSGVIIDGSGVILTVAHVAQAQLLAETLGESTMSCVIRTGNPARTAYKAKLIYISRPWVENNATTLISSQPMGTGENDFALLAITESATGSALPASFPAIALSHNEAGVGEKVQLGGYGGQYLSSAGVRTALSPIFETGTVEDLYTFHGASEDVLSILGGHVAQIGSSGGEATDNSGALIGLITTSEISGDFSTRHLRVITPSHIEYSFKADTGQSLLNFLNAASLSVLVSSFSSEKAELGAYLAHAIGLK